MWGAILISTFALLLDVKQTDFVGFNFASLNWFKCHLRVSLDENACFAKTRHVTFVWCQNETLQTLVYVMRLKNTPKNRTSVAACFVLFWQDLGDWTHSLPSESMVWHFGLRYPTNIACIHVWVGFVFLGDYRVWYYTRTIYLTTIAEQKHRPQLHCFAWVYLPAVTYSPYQIAGNHFCCALNKYWHR